MTVRTWEGTVCDLNENSFLAVCAEMNLDPVEVTLYTADAKRARRIENDHLCSIVLVPRALLKSREMWAVRCGADMVVMPCEDF